MTVMPYNKLTLPRMSALLRRDAANPTGVKFDLGTWVEPDAHGHWDTTNLPAKIETSCGTKACAFGLAAISDEFKAEGLTTMTVAGFGILRRDAATNAEIHRVSIVPILNPEGLKPADAAYHTLPTHFSAAEALFYISAETARYFFDPDCYDGTPREAEGEIAVAERIEAYMNGEIDYDNYPGGDNDED